MNKLKKLTALCLVMALILAIIPAVPASAAGAVRSIEVYENNYTYYENDVTAGKWVDIQQPGGMVRRFSYDPWMSFIYLKLKVKYYDGTYKIFSLLDSSGGLNTDVADYPKIVNPDKNYLWTIDGNNYYTVEYGGATVRVPVRIKESPVELIEILENNYKYIANDASVGMNVQSENGKWYFHYNPAMSLLNLKIRIHFKNGIKKDFCLKDRLPKNIDLENMSFDELIDIVYEAMSLDGNIITADYFGQEQKHWTAGGDNSYYVSYMGASVDVPVTVIKSPISYISVVENPFIYTYHDEKRGNYTSMYYFLYDQIYSYASLLLEIVYEDGSTEYFRPIQSEDGFLLNGYYFYMEDGQSDELWDVGENTYTLHYMGKTIQIPVKVVNNVLLKSAELYNDVDDGRWYTSYIDYSVTYGLFNGTTNKTFEPNSAITRAMFVQVLANVSGVECDRYAVTKFSDVPSGRWYTGAVAWAEKFEIVNGVAPTEFSPSAKITREQMCTMLVRYADHICIPLAKSVEKKTFADDGKISNYAKESVYLCQQAEIIDGIDKYNFAPKETATRAQVAKILSVFHSVYMS